MRLIVKIKLSAIKSYSDFSFVPQKIFYYFTAKNCTQVTPEITEKLNLNLYYQLSLRIVCYNLYDYGEIYRKINSEYG